MFSRPTIYSESYNNQEIHKLRVVNSLPPIYGNLCQNTSIKLNGKESRKSFSCFKDNQPNRYLINLNQLNPKLFYNMQNKKESNKKKGFSKLNLGHKSTYQIDFCNLLEYEIGPYEDKNKDNNAKGSDQDRNKLTKVFI
jgi:hypothetical protein